jgi:hypothetical protein
MKIRIDIDTTPAEARAFFGLPDLEPLQRELIEKLRERMVAGVEGYDPVNVLKHLFPQNLHTLEAMQKAFWQAFTGEPTPRRSEE